MNNAVRYAQQVRTKLFTLTVVTIFTFAPTAHAAAINISGTCKQANQTSNCTDTGTVRVAVNGTLQAQTQITVGATWTIAGVVTPASGDAITVFIDGAVDTREAVAVTKYDGTGNITGIELIEERLSIGSDDNQTVTNADLSQYDNSISGDEDVFHDVNGANDLTVDITGVLSAEELYIKSGNTFRPDSASSSNVATHDLEINGTFIADSNNINVSGSWDNNATFTASNSTVTLNGITDQTVSSSGSNFNHLIVNNTGPTFQNDIILIDALDINGDFTITSGWLDLESYNPTVNTAGNVTIQTNGYIRVGSRTADWIFDGTSILSDMSSGGTQDLQDVVVNGTSLTLASSTKVETMTVTAGTLNLGAANYILNIDGTGTPFSNSATFIAGTSTVYYTGTSMATNIATVAYHSLFIIPAAATNYSLTGHLSGANAMTGSLLILNNASLTTNNYDIMLAGDWYNIGNFTAGTGTVTLNGTGQSVNGSNTFYHLNKSVTSADTLTFDGGETQTINGTVTFSGTSGQLLTLTSPVSSTWYFTLNPGATKAINYVNVSNSNASGSDASQKPIEPANSTDGGNNTDWFSPFTFSGMVYTDEGVTTIADGATVRLLVNGISAGTDTTTAGAYAITPGSLSAGDKVLVYIEGHATDGTTVSIADGSGITGFDIYGTHVIIRNDNGGSTTSVDMNAADSGSAEIRFNVDGSNNLTIGGSGTKFYLPTGHAFTASANVTTPAMETLGTFNGGAGTIDINGSLTIGGGAYTATSGITYIGGDFTILGGTFTHSSGTVELDTNILSTRVLNTGAAQLNNLTLNTVSATTAITDTVDVNGDLLFAEVRGFNGGTITVAGNLTTNATQVNPLSTATIEFDGIGPQSINAGVANGRIPDISISKTGGVLTLLGTINSVGSWRYTNNGANGADVNAGISTIRWVGWSSEIVNSGPMSFNNVIFDKIANNIDVIGTMDVNGDLTITGISAIDAGTIAVAGDVMTTDTVVLGAGKILFDGTTAQLLSAGGGSGQLPAVEINKSNTLTIQDTITVNASSGGPDVWTFTAGVVDATTSTIIITGRDSTMSANNMPFNHVSFNMLDRWQDIAITGTLDVNGNLNLADMSTLSGTITVAGNLTTTDTTGLGGTATITLDGTGVQTIDATGGGDLPNGLFTINKASGEATLLSDLTFNSAGQDLAITSGTLDLNGFNLALTGAGDVLTVNAAGNLQLRGNETVTATTKTLNAGSTVTYDGIAGPYTVKDWDYRNLIFNGAAGVFELGTLESIAENLTITAGTFDINANHLTVAGTFSNDDTLRLQGGETVTLTMDTDSGLVSYDGSGAYASLAAGNSYFNAAFNGTGAWALAAAVDTNGDFTITSGTVLAGGNNINVAGDWSNSAAFTHGGGTQTVTLDGTAQAVNGSTTFNNLTKSITAADSLTFEAGQTTTIDGTVTLNGISGQQLTLASSTGSSAWNFVVGAGATKAIDYVSVSWSDASGSDASQKEISPSNSTDGGNNTDWFRGIPTISVSKLSSLISDPISGTGADKNHIPGAIVEYTITTTNAGDGSPDVNTVIVIDPVDYASLEYDVTTGISFTADNSGLSVNTVTYSHRNTPATYDYTPVGPYDPNVASIKVTTSGTFAHTNTPNPRFSVTYRVRIQ